MGAGKPTFPQPGEPSGQASRLRESLCTLHGRLPAERGGHTLSKGPWVVAHPRSWCQGWDRRGKFRVCRRPVSPAYVSPIWNCRALLGGRRAGSDVAVHLHDSPTNDLGWYHGRVELQPGGSSNPSARPNNGYGLVVAVVDGQDAGKRAELRCSLHRMAFSVWAASHLLRYRPGRRKGLERTPFDLRRATAPAGLANPESRALCALRDGWAFTQPQVVQGTRVLYGIYLRKVPVTKKRHNVNVAASFPQGAGKPTFPQPGGPSGQASRLRESLCTPQGRSPGV